MTSEQCPREEHVAVVGAGLAGSLLAVFLGRRGYHVDLFEKREDFRKEVEEEQNEDETVGRLSDSQKRSINLALSHRGREGLRALGLEEKVMERVVPMQCRAIHSKDGNMSYQPYSSTGECIYSVSRQMLNHLLLDEADKYHKVRTFFGSKITNIAKDGTLSFTRQDGTQESKLYRCVFGADGAYSAVRQAILRNSRANFSREYIAHGYKELTMPPSKDGDYVLPCPNALHIWPRHEFMMIALPNPDKSFTCTMFAPYETFDDLNSNSEKVQPFFEKNFPDALPLIPQIKEQFAHNPTGALVTIRMKPWNLNDRIVVLGDAAHAVVPFFGQGMNAAFEDVLSFDETLVSHNFDMSTAVPQWAKERQPAGDGIADLSYGNYVEMRSHTASTRFLLRKRLESVIHWLFPKSWVPLYTMVSFTRTPYHIAKERAERQEKILKYAEYASYSVVLGGLAAVGAKYAGKYIDRLKW